MLGKLHTIGLPLKLAKREPNRSYVEEFKKWIKANWNGETNIRILWHKDYDVKAEELILAIAVASIELNSKCFLVTNIPQEIVSGAIYIIVAYDNSNYKLFKKLLLSNMVLVIGDKPTVDDNFIMEV